jgi:hypothetical protein
MAEVEEAIRATRAPLVEAVVVGLPRLSLSIMHFASWQEVPEAVAEGQKPYLLVVIKMVTILLYQTIQRSEAKGPMPAPPMMVAGAVVAEAATLPLMVVLL